MAPTPLTTKQAYILTPAGVTQGQLDQLFQASDPVNGNLFISSGKDMLLVQNLDPATQTFGILSAPDQFGRFANITYTVVGTAGSPPTQVGGFAAVIITSASIYTQADGTVRLTSTSANLKFLVLQGA